MEQPRPLIGGEGEFVDSYSGDPDGQARIEQARSSAAAQRMRDRQAYDTYFDACENGEETGLTPEQLAEQHPEDSPAERLIRIGLYHARLLGEIIDDSTARRIADQLQSEPGSALGALAATGAIRSDQLLTELQACQVEPSWRVHWIEALTSYVRELGEQEPVAEWPRLDDDGREEATEQHRMTDEPSARPSAQHSPATAAVERAESPRRPDPRIYIACLASYNHGILHGLWIDADQDVEDLQADVVAMLASSPIPGAEEWAIHDHEGFHGFELGEYEDLAVVSRVAKGIAEHGEAFAVYVGWAGTDETAIAQFGDHFMGTYDSVDDWVQEVADDQEWSRKLDEAMDLLVRPHVAIDYRSFAEHMESDGWQLVRGREGVHVFAP